MTIGSKRAQAPADQGSGDAEPAEWQYQDAETATDELWLIESEESRPVGPRLFAGLLILLAAGWIGASAWMLVQSQAYASVPATLAWIGSLAPPLVLLGLLWVLFGRTPRRETERFSRAVAKLHGESAALESLLAIVASRMEDNHARLTSETTKLMSLGDEASDRLGRVAHYLSKESVTLDKKADALELAANAARVDIGVLLEDLPRAEEKARAIAAAMKEAGFAAHEQSGALEGQLSALVARGREADEVVGGAAQRLGSHLGRIESTASAATARIDEATASMIGAIDETMTRAADAVDATRSGLEGQGNALLAMIAQSHSAFTSAGDETSRHLSQRLETISGKVEALASHLAAQDAASQSLLSRLAAGLADLDERFVQLGQSGSANANEIGAHVDKVRDSLRDLFLDLSESQEGASGLVGRANDLSQALTAVTAQLNNDVPAALAQVGEQAEATKAIAEGIAPTVDAIRAAADEAASRVGEAEASVGRQHDALDAMLTKVGEGVTGAETQLRALGEAVAEADSAANQIVERTGPELIDALVRVRDAAHQAAERAREAIAAVIPQSAAALGDASRAAVSEAIGDEVRGQMDEINAVAERAVEAARGASERLTRQLLTIGQAAHAVETRIAESREEREAEASESFSRRVALLIESLNSTAIDVTKILSNEVTDSAWAAYLKGDRGVFTRRAVRLLDATEAREIVQHYEAEPEFREQVNRYIHDFEAMLRRVLADRDGSPLSVALLSSDMGKLYVALAQAIERLRG